MKQSRFRRVAIKVLMPVISMVSAFSFFSVVSHADSYDIEPPIEISEVNFPDYYFRTYVLQNIDANGNGFLDEEEILNTKSIDAHLTVNIDPGPSDLTGIQYFTSLKRLTCSNNHRISSLDLSHNTELTSLDCDYMKLTSLDLSNNTKLTSLRCGYGKLTNLNISNNTQLEYLYCHNNQLSSLNVSNNTKLIDLVCMDNPISTLNLENNTNIQKLAIYNTNLDSIDLSKNTKLTQLYAHGTSITELNISKCPSLVELYTNSVPDTSSGYNSHSYTQDSLTYTLTYKSGTSIVYSESEPISAPEVTGHSLILSDEIGVRFRVAFPDGFDATNCYMRFATPGGRVSEMPYDKSTLINANNERYFEFRINALELADTITARLYYGESSCLTNQYSAMEYIQYIEDHYFDYTAQMGIVNALHNYGYFLQRSGWNDNRAHMIIPAPTGAASVYNSNDTAYVAQAVLYQNLYKDLGTSGISDSVKVGLTLNSKTQLRVSVKPEEGVKILSSGYTERIIDGQTYYQFSVTGIGPKKLSYIYDFTIETDHGTAAIHVSPLYYIKAMFSNGTSLSDDQLLVLTSLYKYWEYANSYTGN